jgi:hypothetical protein
MGFLLGLVELKFGRLAIIRRESTGGGFVSDPD